MTDLPTGTVTFLFTDIEGSTPLWEREPEQMRFALAHHDAILRMTIANHGGHTYKIIGDAFQAAFVFPAQALAAALAAQRALAAQPWETSVPLRVRMGLHVGSAVAEGNDYTTTHTLNRVARIMSAGHGGQILLSVELADLVRRDLPTDVTMRDMGKHRMKGLTHLEHLFQVAAPDLPSVFPPLKTLDPLRTNLPTQLTSFIGREQAIAEVKQLLHTSRLITLTGPGGTGKTRLALQVAAELLDTFVDGVWFVDLAPLSDPDLVIPTIMQTMELKELGGQPPLEQIKAFLRDKQLLLLLDNFEQVVDAATRVAELLAAAPQLSVLLTSRVVLHLRGEQEFMVPPLALPTSQRLPSWEDVSQYAAAALFIERARDVRPDFQVTNANAPAIAEICYRLDGLPLAIELAAARVKLFPPQALLTRLDNRLKFLTVGARDLSPRQQTIRNTIDWSYHLLDVGEQRLFARLSVFVGGCTLEAAEEICNADGDLPTDVIDGMAGLVDQSLLRPEEHVDDEPRFAMLETLREYALERLKASGEAERIWRQHAAYYLALAEASALKLLGEEQAVWLDRLEREHDNIRAALVWSLVERDDFEMSLRFGAALWEFWALRGKLSEGRHHLTHVLSRTEEHTALRAKVLNAAGYLATLQNDSLVARAIYEQSLAIFQELNDKQGIAYALYGLGRVAWTLDEDRLAVALSEESLTLFRELQDTWGIAQVLTLLGDAADSLGDYARALALYEESLVLSRSLGNRWGIAGALNDLGVVLARQGDYKRAEGLFEESLALFQEIGDQRRIAYVLARWGDIAWCQHNTQRAIRLHEEALSICQSLDLKGGAATSREVLGYAALYEGNYKLASRFFAESLALWRHRQHLPGIIGCVVGLAGVARGRGQLERAVRLLSAADALRNPASEFHEIVDRFEYGRNLTAAQAQLDAATFAAVWNEGQALPLEQAIAYALEPPAALPSPKAEP